jgi:hypothetical protein
MEMERQLVAPCGIDCRVCRAYIRVGKSKSCPGCRVDDPGKAISCITCKIKNCEKLVTGKLEYCIECAEFPCLRVKHLDKRYRTRYGTSPIGNLAAIREIGIDQFIETEQIKWTCPECGSMLSMHKPQCLSCGYTWNIKE